MEGDVDLGNVGQDEGEVGEERRLCVWRGREVVRGMRECASDSWAALRRRAPNLRVPVLLFSVVLEETFSHSFCPLLSL